jgi:hypothetical protein
MRVIVAFKNNRSKKVWMKSFLSLPSAKRAVSGILKKTRNSVMSNNGTFSKSTRSPRILNAKGIRYKSDLKKINKTKKLTTWNKY